MAQKIKRRTFIKTSSVFALGLGAYNMSCLRSQTLVLVKEGRQAIPIVTAADAPAETLLAAGKMAEYIFKISGARPEVLHGTGLIPESAVWIGIQPHLSKVFRGLESGFQHPEEILIACNGQHLLITGRDLVVDHVQVEYGTANAVYTFLEKYLNVRWLWPGELGEDIIRRETIAIPSFVYRFHPKFLDRQNVFNNAAKWKRADDWTRLQRLKLSSMIKGLGCHSFSEWYDKFYNDHPEWFALQPDGTRGTFPDDKKRVKVCLSNPEVADRWLADVEETIKINPGASVFWAGENDDYSSGICVCKSCRAWDHPGGVPWSYGYAKGSPAGYKDYVAMTNRLVTFWNILAKKLKERFPDKDLYVLGMAYGPYRMLPVDVTLEKNIIVSFVGCFPLDPEEKRQSSVWGKTLFEGWSQITHKMHYRPNQWYSGGGNMGLPEVALKNTIEDFPFLAGHKCIGIEIDSVREHWATQGPQYYLMAQLAWDPSKDGQSVLEDYYRRGFGEAAEEIKEYWNLMEEVTREVYKWIMEGIGLVNGCERAFTADFFNRAESQIRQAETLVANEPEKYRKRVDFVRTGLEFTRLMISNIPFMTRIRESGGKDKEAIEVVDKNWETIKQLCNSAGPMALHYNALVGTLRTRHNYEDYFGPVNDKFRKVVGKKYKTVDKTLIDL